MSNHSGHVFVKKILLLLFLVNSFFSSGIISATNAVMSPIIKAKYASGVVPLHFSHKYIREHEAPTYWKISPYYISQRNESSCSLATAAMIINAARSSQPKANQSLATQDGILALVKDRAWEDGVKVGGEGVTLDQFRILMAKALEAYGLQNFEIQVIHTKNSSGETALLLHKALVKSEKTGQTFLIANFDQKFFTGAESVGHFTPVGAYDAQTQRVLLMDPDRELYEPYWVPESLLLQGMATVDADAHNYRGYMLITFKL